MAILYKTDGSSQEVHPKNGSDFKLDELRDHVGGGYIELVYLPNKMLLVVDDEGAINDMPINIKASEVASGIIHGDAVYCKSAEVE